MIIVVDWDVKHKIKQVSSKFEQLVHEYFCGNIFCFRFGYILDYVTK